MGTDELMKVVAEVLEGPCGVRRPITGESRLLEDLELDSMGMLALAVGLENRFRVKLEEDPENAPATVNELVSLLSQRLGRES